MYKTIVYTKKQKKATQTVQQLTRAATLVAIGSDLRGDVAFRRNSAVQLTLAVGCVQTANQRQVSPKGTRAHTNEVSA